MTYPNESNIPVLKGLGKRYVEPEKDPVTVFHQGAFFIMGESTIEVELPTPFERVNWDAVNDPVLPTTLGGLAPLKAKLWQAALTSLAREEKTQPNLSDFRGGGDTVTFRRPKDYTHCSEPDWEAVKAGHNGRT